MSDRIVIGPGAVRPTRFKELGFRNDGHGLWRIYTTDTENAIGPHYASMAELLGDLARYAKEYGCENT